MNKAQMVEAVAAKLGKTKKETFEMVNAFLDEIVGCLKRGESAKISGFGNFNVKSVDARDAVNPMTKDPIKVEACKKVSFKASEVLKEDLK